MSSSSACPHLAVQKVPFPNLTSEKVLQIAPRKRVCEMGWKARMGNGCWLSLNLVRFVGWSWIGAADTWQGRVVELSSPATSSRVQSATSRGRGGRCRQGEDFFSPLANKSEKLSQFLKTVCREWDGGWKIEMCHIKGVLKR